MYPFESNVSDYEYTLPRSVNAVRGNDLIMRFLADSTRYLELVPESREEINLHLLLKQYCNKEKS